MKILLLLVLSAVLIQLSIQKTTHTYNTCFTSNPAANNILESFEAIVLSSGNDGYQSQVDPSTVPGYRKGIIAYWPMDSSDGNGFTADKARPGTHPGKLVSASIDSNGGKFSGGLSLYGNGYMTLAAPGPLVSDFAIQFGFTYGIWAKPTDLSGYRTLLEQQYNQPALTLTSTTASCTVHNAAGDLVKSEMSINNPVNTWTHFACRYDPVNGLSLCVNGACAAYGGVTIDVLGASYAITAIGSRPLDSAIDPFVGVLDELAIWNHPLSDSDVAALSTASSALDPYYGGSFTTKPLEISDLGISDNTIIDFWEVVPTWTVTPIGGSSSDPNVVIKLEISTNTGVTWCPISSGSTLSFDNAVCAWPASHVQFRVTFEDNVIVNCVQLVLTLQPDLSWSYFPLGINISPYYYFSPSWVYTDAFKCKSKSETGFPNNGYLLAAGRWTCANQPCYSVTFDENSWPVSGIDPNSPPSLIMLDRQQRPETFPGKQGPFTFMAEGEGTVRLSFACFDIIEVNGPTTKSVTCAGDNAAVIQVVITATNPNNPVRNIKLLFPGMETIGLTQKFHPLYLDRFNGSYVARFMEMMETNNNNIAHWEDRNLPSYAGQTAGRTYMYTITNFADASNLGFNSFLRTKWVAKVTVSTPHRLVRGQKVSLVTNPSASASMTLSNSSPYYLDLSTLTGMVDPVDDTSFLIAYGLPEWESNVPSLNYFTASNGGTVTVEIRAGNPYEDMMEYCNTVNTHIWINIPALATDDFITQFATLVRDTLNPNLKIYVEYSNEIWNYLFSQLYAIRNMGLANGLSENDIEARLKQQVLRSAQIMTIFKDVFGESDFNQRIIKVLGSQVVVSSMADSLLTYAVDSNLNPNGIKFDGIAVAPYFGGINDLITAEFAKGNTPTVDFVLDLTRDSLWSDTIFPFRSVKEVTDRHGSKLFAYEGGLGLAPDLRYVPQQLPLYLAASQHPRMKNIVKHFLYQWMASGADLHVTYTNYFEPTQYGLWGTLEYQDQPLDTAYKYQAWNEVLNVARYAPVIPHSVTPQYISSPQSTTPDIRVGESPSTSSSPKAKATISGSDKMVHHLALIVAIALAFI